MGGNDQLGFGHTETSPSTAGPGLGKSGPGGGEARGGGDILKGRGQVNEDTGQYNSWDERVWSGMTGKNPPTQPHLPKGMQWAAPMIQGLSGGAAGAVNYGPSSEMSRLFDSIDIPGIGAAGNRGIGMLSDAGSADSVARTTDELTTAMLPGLDRAFERGTAGIRENAALSGNIGSSGVMRESGDLYSGLFSDLSNRVAGLVPQVLNTRAGAGASLAGMPVSYGSQLFAPQQNFLAQLPWQALGTLFQGIAGLPYFANQGGGGGGGAGAALGSIMCWIAEELFGRDAIETHCARFYVMHVAPEWFTRLYARYGQRAAAFLHAHPRFKPLARPIFHMFAARGYAAMQHRALACL